MLPELTSADSYAAAHARSLADPEGFWGEVAQSFFWHQHWNQVLQGRLEDQSARWFEGATTNLCANCLDRHLPQRAHQVALIFEPNDPATPPRRFTYAQLHAEVQRVAFALRQLGVGPGDRVGIYLPNVPEAAMAMLACVRLGAIHSVVFGGFSAQSLAERLNHAGCRLLITADGAQRGNKNVPLKRIADEALHQCPGLQQVLVLQHTGQAVDWLPGRDRWWHESLPEGPVAVEAVPVAATHPSFILYTSGSTGKPKGLVHSTGGYMVYVGYTLRNVFQTRENDVFFCTADVGWITGHSYLVYGPLLNGLTTLMFEGIPTWPDAGRFWEVVDRHRANVFYTAPTAIRALEACGLEPLQNKRLDSLRVLGSVGEPINEEAWQWYYQQVGRNQCPIVDTWWQTETGGILISTLAGLTPSVPAWATLPLPGIAPQLLNERGEVLSAPEAEGLLVLERPWPGMALGTWGEAERFAETYLKPFPGYYFTGDGARRNAAGHYRITGRVDDVINVSGHRIGTAEVENALTQHPHIVECAVVGIPHPIKGSGIYAFAVAEAHTDPQKLEEEAKALVVQHIGALARPERVQFTRGLPKTRSGKIMRRVLRKIAEGQPDQLGDTSTLLDPSVVDDLVQGFVAP